MTPPKTGAGLGEYLKRAFLFRWNVLGFAAAVAASLLSTRPDALLPLVAAGELVYLVGLMASHKFREAVDAQVYKESKQMAASQGQRSIQQIVGALPPESRRRFEQLRGRCLEMRSIAHGVRGRTGEAPPPAEDLSSSALDRLLWVFLRLLTSQEALHRFLDRTDPAEIRSRLQEAKARLEAQKGGDERIIRSLEDSVAAQQMRLDNYQRAENNAEFVRIELDRIEAKIQALTEASVNRQDPDFLSSQIDSVAENVQSTEKAIRELQQITGLVDEMQEPPVILDADLGQVTQR
jgi:hypothetical protein